MSAIQVRYLKLTKGSLSNQVRCVNTVPSSSTETLRMMTGLQYAGTIKGKLDGTAYPQGTGTEYPPDRLGLAHSSGGLGSGDEDGSLSWIGEIFMTE